jgi:hypothetical protein
MTFRLGMAVCLCGIVACSHHNSEPAKTAANEPETWAMRPASLEGPVAPNAVAPTAKTAPDAAQLPDQWPALPNVAPPTHESAFFPDDPRAKQRDLGTTDLTLLDEHSARADLRITQDIRDALNADRSLSSSGAAKRVKIVTQEGNVTLSGSVKSEEERRTIDLAARRIAGALKVENRIEVAP